MQIRIRYIRPDGQIVPAQLCKARDGALSLEMTEKDRPDEQALYLGAPWIDAHCHVFEAVTSFGLSPDSIGLQTACTCWWTPAALGRKPSRRSCAM